MHLRAYLAAGLVVALAAGALWLDRRAYWRGWDAHAARVAAETREKQQELFRLADRLSEAERQRAEMEEQLSSRAREIEDEVRADTDVCRHVAPDSVRRLQRRWGGGSSD